MCFILAAARLKKPRALPEVEWASGVGAGPNSWRLPMSSRLDWEGVVRWRCSLVAGVACVDGAGCSEEATPERRSGVERDKRDKVAEGRCEC